MKDQAVRGVTLTMYLKPTADYIITDSTDDLSIYLKEYAGKNYKPFKIILFTFTSH